MKSILLLGLDKFFRISNSMALTMHHAVKVSSNTATLHAPPVLEPAPFSLNFNTFYSAPAKLTGYVGSVNEKLFVRNT